MSNALTRLAAAVQGMPPVKKNAKGHQHTYLDLPGLIGHVTPVLMAHGLAAVTEATTDDAGRIGVRALFVGPDDVYETPWFWLPPARNDQEAGGKVTYGRRYVLSCALGLPEVDTISQSKPAAPKKAASAVSTNVKRLQIAFNEAGIMAREDRLTFCIETIGHVIGSSKDLTPDEVKQVLKALTARTA